MLIALCFCLSLLLSTTTTRTPPPYTPTDLIVLNCGSSSQTTSPDGRSWQGDVRSKFLLLSSQTSSSQASQQNPSVPDVPYMTATISHTNFTYTFYLSPGPKFLRLHFYPDTYRSALNSSTSFFTVTANGYTLVRNFSAYLTAFAGSPPVDFFLKEFIVTVQENQELNLSFIPSPTSFAFINGIEIVSIPNNLYIKNMEHRYTPVNSDTSFYFDNKTFLETMYRLNVGGGSVSSVDDTGMFRTWSDDTDYIFGGDKGIVHYSNGSMNWKLTPEYAAPEVVYLTKRSMGLDPKINLNYNLTWLFPVDSGFTYLIRLHFCETDEKVAKLNLRPFVIFINNMTAEPEADIIHWSGGLDTPVYRDYVVWFPVGGPDRQDMWLALYPNRNLQQNTADAVLNGVDIFKLNSTDGSLAGSNPELMEEPVVPGRGLNSSRKKRGSRITVVAVSVIIGGGVLILSLTLCLCFLKRKTVRTDNANANATIAKPKSFAISFYRSIKSSSYANASTNSIRRFSIFEIEVATAKFDDEFLIGSGGFGNVYKGFVDDGETPVAIKRLNSSSTQGFREFKTEIQLLSKLDNTNLVTLIGYCDDPGEMILVYEYMHRGTLRDHLYKTKNPPIPWKKRVEICIGAARGLHYLHTGAKPPIIHRDVKSTNILIDENWVAKVSDFGLSRMGPTSNSQTHVSTVVRGSFGYVDPEYYRRQHLTEKSDVYSFGVVLLEVLCARPPVIPGLPREQVNLADWARICYRRGGFSQIADKNLMGDVSPACLEKFGEIAESCLRDQGRLRPAMSDVVFGLELTLQLQESNAETITDVPESSLLSAREDVAVSDADEDDDLFSGSCGRKEESKSSISSCLRSVDQSDPDRFLSQTVFSEIMDPKGR